MPYDSNGNATVTRNRAVTGQTVQADQVNTPFDDVQSMLSQVLLRSGAAPMTGALNMNGFKIAGSPDATAPTDLVTLGQIQYITPIGSVLSFAGSTAPTGWMLCYGQTVSRITYAALFSTIGTSFGVGDGLTTFNLPDCRGRIEAGKDDMGGTDSSRLSFFGSLAKALGGAFGAATHVLTFGQMPRHNHGINDPGHVHGGVQNGTQSTGRSTSIDQPPAVYSRGNTETGFTGISIQDAGNDQAHNNTQPTIIFNKIIKVQ